MKLLAFGVGIMAMLVVAGCNNNSSTDPQVPASGEVCVLSNDDKDFQLQPFVSILKDTTPSLSLQDIVQPSWQQRFEYFDHYTAPIETNQFYWGKLQVQNNLARANQYTEWVLAFTDSWTSVDIFLQEKDGTWRREKNGAFTPDRMKSFVPTTSGNLFRIVLPPNETTTIYFRGASERTAIYPSFYIRLKHIETFYNDLVTTKAGNAIFIGFVLMMLFYNLILYFIGGGRSFLYYSGYLFMVVTYSAFSSNDLVDWLNLFPEHPAYPRFLKLSLYLGMMFYLAFIRRFLNLKTLLPWWDSLFKIVIYLGLPLMVADVVVLLQTNFSFVVEDRITVPFILLIIIVCAGLVYPLWRTRDRVGYFVIAGIAAITLGCLLTVVSRVFLPPFSIVYLKAGIIVEILIFSLGLAYRQRWQKQAQQQADFRLRESELIQEKKQLEADRLKELNDFKARFYTNITHEFRTPLTVIMGMADNIKGHEEEKKLIRRNSQNLLQLINQLLDLSKLESDTLSLRLTHRDIIPYLQYLTESFYSAAAQQQIRLLFYTEEKSLWMDYDEVKVQQIVYNLLSNALKFTKEKGQVIFHASQTEREGRPYLKLKVKDNGIGIPPENIAHIFDRFYQVNPADSAMGVSTGIGLALVKELADLMKGTLTVESEVGKGTEFVLLLPVEATVPAADMPGSWQKEGQPTITDIQPGIPVESVEPVAAEADMHLDTSLPQLLIIEDNEDIIAYIKTILANDYQIHTAGNGALGITRALELIPDIIISDVMMPEKNGYEVCGILKQDERTSHIPIILLTAKATQADRVEGLKYGADAYLTKPFDKEELLVRLEKLVALRRQWQQRYAQGSPAQAPAQPTMDEQFLQKLTGLISHHLEDADFGVPELAAAVAMSQIQMYRKIKALTGKTPSQFIRSQRLGQGLALLQKGDLTIAEIAYAVGFNEPSYFSRVFQQEFGKSPSDYLK